MVLDEICENDTVYHFFSSSVLLLFPMCIAAFAYEAILREKKRIYLYGILHWRYTLPVELVSGIGTLTDLLNANV